MGFEDALDAETVLGISRPTPLIAYNVGGKTTLLQTEQLHTDQQNEWYLEWLQLLLAQPKLPQVITISYADEEQSVFIFKR